MKKGVTSTEFAKLPADKRKEMSERLRARRPANFPAVLVRHNGSNLSELPECRILLKENMYVLQVKQDIKQHVYAGKASDKQALFLFHDGLILPDGMTVKEVVDKYNRDKQKDGWFYIKYHNQQTF